MSHCAKYTYVDPVQFHIHIDAVGPSLACKVMPDLEKFMETMNTKMSSAYDMVEVLEDPSNPPPMERYNVKLIQTIIFLVMHIFVYVSI